MHKLPVYQVLAHTVVCLGCALLLAGCLDSGPQKTLNTLARALTDRDSALFLQQMDGKAFATNTVRGMARDDPALRALDSVGRLLGLGGMENLVNSVVDMQARQEAQFTRGVSTGELVLECSRATTPDCPWTPEALKSARVIEIDQEAAIARVTTPAGITSWLALRKAGENWLVVGQAPLEAVARQYAGNKGDAAAPAQPAAPGQPDAPKPDRQKPEEPTVL